MPFSKRIKTEGNLDIINENIIELKKKIQLSEGQRKAHFEECDTERKKNVEKIRILKKEVKETYKKLGEPLLSCSDTIEKISNKYPKEAGTLRNKKLEDAIDVLDLKCIDLNKQLDVYKYKNKMKKIQLKKIAEKYKDIVTSDANKEVKNVEVTSDKSMCVLENQIHRVELNMMEAEHVNKKYKTICLHLLSDSISFESTLRKLEARIQKQRAEIQQLELINKEAVGLRDATKGTLLRHEISALNAGKSRESQFQNFSRRVEEKKLELERLERRIFSGGRVIFDEGSESNTGTVLPESTNNLVTQLEIAFDKLKIATGETEIEDVLPRFLSQKNTKERLDFLKKIMESEKKQLEIKKENCLVELENYKFSEVKDKKQNQEKLDKLKKDVEYQNNLKQKYLKEIEKIREQYMEIIGRVYNITKMIQHANNELPQESSDSMDTFVDIINFLNRKIQSGISKINLCENLEQTMKEIEKKQFQQKVQPIFVPNTENEDVPLFPELALRSEGKQSKTQQPSVLVPDSEDEENIPSRTYLKRQAQLIVDAKSRKKFSRVLNFTKTKK